MTVFGDRDHVLPAYAAPPGIVEARLHGDNHARFEHDGPDRADSRPFMSFKADAMPEGMREMFRRAMLREILPGRGVKFCGGYSRLDSGDGPALGFLHQIESTPEYRMIESKDNPVVKRTIFQTPTKKGKGVLVAMTTHGNYITGPTSRVVDNPECSDVDDEGLAVLDECSKKSVPGLNFMRSIRVFSGVRAKPDTGDFMIYASKNMQGVIHVGGIESPGSTQIGRASCRERV